jgi:hypothetical protein
MNRILTFAEFAKSFNQKGTDLGNTPKDVDALASSTDQFTADGDGGACADGGKPETIDNDGTDVVALAVKTDGNDDEAGEEFDVNDDGQGSEEEEEFVNGFDDEDGSEEDDAIM